MKALTIRQPWCHVILYDGKRIENRVWRTHFRGEFLLHASKRILDGDIERARRMVEELNGAQASEAIPESFPRGGIVGIARLIEVVEPTARRVASHYPLGIDWRWHTRDQFGFVLADVRPLPFMPWKGARLFFDVPDAIARAALARA
jgi:hypothetical protein